MRSLKREERDPLPAGFLCGALIGAGAILPGVSGGVLAVIFDVYRPLMETLTHPKRGFLQYWHIFLPLGIGWAAGFLGLARGHHDGLPAFCHGYGVAVHRLDRRYVSGAVAGSREGGARLRCVDQLRCLCDGGIFHPLLCAPCSAHDGRTEFLVV